MRAIKSLQFEANWMQTSGILSHCLVSGCKLKNYGFIYKYMWTIKVIVDKEFQYLLDLLPSGYSPHGFIQKLRAL